MLSFFQFSKYAWLLVLCQMLLGCHGDSHSKKTGKSVKSSQSSKPLKNTSANKEGWIYLFDGNDISKWRGINLDSFPEDGWEIKDRTLMITAEDGKESKNGGDIITKQQFENFILD